MNIGLKHLTGSPGFMLPTVIATGFFLIMLVVSPISMTFQFNEDEGIELMKAALIQRGYRLYSDIEYDETPLFTLLLVQALRFNDFSVSAGRVLVLLFSCLLIGSIFQIQRLLWGLPHALASLVLLFLLPSYLRLSIVIILSLPAIALAVFALLALIQFHRTRQVAWLILSAVALSASVLVKLFTGYLAPLFFAGLLVDGYRQAATPHRLTSIKWQPAVAWLATFTACTAFGLVAWVGLPNLPLLVYPHLQASDQAVFQQEKYTLWHHLRDSYANSFLAVIGCLYLLRSRRWLSLYPLAWGLSSLAALANYAPVWYHHQFLVTVPAAMLASIAVGETIRILPRLRRPGVWLTFRGFLAALSMLGIFFVFSTRSMESLSFLTRKFQAETSATGGFDLDYAEWQAFVMVNAYASQTHWMVTDLPIYAFRAHLLTPPNLAVITQKLMASGVVSEAEILATIQQYRPEQVLLGRFEVLLDDPYLAEQYCLIFDRKDIRLYLRCDLAAP